MYLGGFPLIGFENSKTNFLLISMRLPSSFNLYVVNLFRAFIVQFSMYNVHVSNILENYVRKPAIIINYWHILANFARIPSQSLRGGN
jgi:hypothetical protein